MKSFKHYYESKEPLGLIETINIDGLGPIEAKVDSGNGAYNVLHGYNIIEDGNKVTFFTVGDKKIAKEFVEKIDINVGSGHVEERPVVQFDIEIGDKHYKNVKFSIGDRTDNEYKILVGKDFIEELGGIIDVSKEGNLD